MNSWALLDAGYLRDFSNPRYGPTYRRPIWQLTLKSYDNKNNKKEEEKVMKDKGVKVNVDFNKSVEEIASTKGLWTSFDSYVA